ncbi:MAG TPA: hypothetical protein VFZ65_23125 [Planctomycetota bacterium]|nr:hypothetical protein [Planctomycetota bacterium]
MRKTKTSCLSLLLLALPCACGQLRYRDGAPSRAFASGVRVLERPVPQEPGPQEPTKPEPGQQEPAPPQPAPQQPAPGRTERRVVTRREGTPYGQTRVRLQFFREDVEFDELDVEVDNSPDVTIKDVDRDRFGFRAEFGQSAGGFFQVFAEQMRAPALLLEEFDNFGIGGGAVGAPVVADVGPVDLIVPYRFEVDLAAGSETVSGFDEDLFYFEAMFELGFGARAFGAQMSTGVLVNSQAGWFDSDNPASVAGTDTTRITGTNVGAFFELLYKADRVPLMARVRGVVGDISGLMFSFGFAF